MRVGSFSEHVSTYFNLVLETFTDYYPSSAQNFLPQISSAFSRQELPYNLNTIYSVVTIVLLVLYLFKRLLHLDQMGEAPLVHMKEEESGVDELQRTSKEEPKDGAEDTVGETGAEVEKEVHPMKIIMEKCTVFKSVYKPTWFWGKSGHVQTVLFGVMQKPHRAIEVSECKPYFVTLPDTSVVSFHVYEPLKPHQSESFGIKPALLPGEEITLLICPGIFGSYNKSYVQSTIGAACARGYRIVCLNHLGVLDEVELKTPRLFTYGNTEEYAAMCDKVMEMFPDSKFISLGYSMGGNQICKYLGERPERQEKFVAALSICQGYDCIRAARGLKRWDKMQALYSYILTQRWISLVEKHPIVMQTAVERGINWKDVKAARGLGQFDYHFSSKYYGYDSFEKFMTENSCSQHLDKIDIPLLLINAIDDPLIGPLYHDIPLAVAKKKSNVAFVETHHGGHLGYFEKGMFYPREVWLDSAILQYCDAAIETMAFKTASKKTSTSSDTSEDKWQHAADSATPGDADMMTNSDSLTIFRSSEFVKSAELKVD